MILSDIAKFICKHPLNAGRRLQALGRFLRWQVGSWILDKPVVCPFVNDSCSVVTRGMSSATGNIYVGLMEFEEMGFLLHYLRSTDVFIDVGANVGTYTILAGKVVGAKCLAVEPSPETFHKLMDNIYLNRIQDRVTTLNMGIGKEKGVLRFTAGMDSVNHVLSEEETSEHFIEIEVLSLDAAAENLRPEIVKVDVEGYENEVVAGGGRIFSDHSLNVVLMELRGHGAKFGFDERRVDRQMHNLGFEAYLYNPLNRSLCSRINAQVSLGDMLYIRDIDKARKRIAGAPYYVINGKRF